MPLRFPRDFLVCTSKPCSGPNQQVGEADLGPRRVRPFSPPFDLALAQGIRQIWAG